MKRHLRSVPATVWNLSEEISGRHLRLLKPPHANDVLAHVLEQATAAADSGLVSMEWQESCEAPGHFRLVAQIPLQEVAFDQFFNGCTGYRAQFYLSPEEGVLYNRDTLDALVDPLCCAYERCSLRVTLDKMIDSLGGPHAKVWVFKDKEAFNEAPACSLNPPRWAENCAVLGRRAPLPRHLTLDVKGAFLHGVDGTLFVDEVKVDRACQIHNNGFA